MILGEVNFLGSHPVYKGGATVDLLDRAGRLDEYANAEVSVLGEIQFPASHVFIEKRDAFDYIDLSGGYTSRSEKKPIYVIKSSGDVAAVKNGWLIKRNSDIYPGDTIIASCITYAIG